MSDPASRREDLAGAASSARAAIVPPATSGTVRTAITASTFVVAMALHQLAFGKAAKPPANAIPLHRRSPGRRHYVSSGRHRH
jgi:hypothetical protein